MTQWTIQIFYEARDDNGKQFRATAAYQVEANSVGEAYDIAEQNLPGKKLGAIMAGHHVRFP